jgi:gluconolactonase
MKTEHFWRIGRFLFLSMNQSKTRLARPRKTASSPRPSPPEEERENATVGSSSPIRVQFWRFFLLMNLNETRASRTFSPLTPLRGEGDRSARILKWVIHFVLAAGLMAGASTQAQNLAGDMALSGVLIDGENWEVVAQGYQFTDAPCADAEGNFYFTDVAKGTNIFKVGADGKIVPFIGNAARISGLKFGPDGRLYACQGGYNRLIAIEVPSGNQKIIAEDVQPNDLVITRKGRIYFTETGKKQVTLIDTNGAKRVVDNGINAPNGITLSADQGTLAVSDYRGAEVWVFRINADGSLSAKEPYMTMRTPLNNPTVAAGDGMTTDSMGRYYVTTAVGLQMFDSTGRLGGVISKPQNKSLSSVAFAGPNLEYLYVTCADKVYRRKTKAKGVIFASQQP